MLKVIEVTGSVLGDPNKVRILEIDNTNPKAYQKFVADLRDMGFKVREDI